MFQSSLGKGQQRVPLVPGQSDGCTILPLCGPFAQMTGHKGILTGITYTDNWPILLFSYLSNRRGPLSFEPRSEVTPAAPNGPK